MTSWATSASSRLVAVGEGPQADERFGDADVCLDRDYAGRVVHREVESAPTSSSPATVPGGAPAWASSTQRAVTSAITSASACWSSLSGPGRSR